MYLDLIRSLFYEKTDTHTVDSDKEVSSGNHSCELK